MIQSILFKIKKFFRPRTHKQLKDLRDRLYCMVWLVKPRDKLYYFTYLKKQKVPAGAYEVKYQGEPIRVLGLDEKGFYPIKVPEQMEKDKSPLDLFIALNCAAEVDEVYGLSASLREKIKLGIFIILAVTMLIIIFLMSAQFMGGGTPV